MFRAPRGTRDILPDEHYLWEIVLEKAKKLCEIYGYRRIDTPIFEDALLFLKGVGEETDIAEKEMYVFKDKSGKDLALRPEMTAPIARAYIEHGMHTLPGPLKLYYIGPCFRYERPQAGRYREHHQFGVEALGEEDPLLDAEVIDMGTRFLKELGIDFSLHINSIGCKKCRPKYI
ncbi:MAG: histidine--tRNA ligase, partial [Thermoplasmata archaeon]